MSGYMAGQSLLKTLLLTITGSFGANDVTESDYRVLDSGATNACVLKPGGIPQYDLAGMAKSQNWECIADLFTKFVDDTSFSTFGTLRDAVVLKLDQAPALSASYFMMLLTADGDIEPVYDKQNGGPFFLTQRLRIIIQEQQ